MQQSDGIREKGASSIYHDNARSTEPTLTTVTLRDTLLSRMRLLDIADPFDSDDMLTVNTDKWS